MAGYWTRHRLLYSIIVCVVLAVLASLLFVRPYLHSRANSYNAQSVYKNTTIDFIVPEPSFDQVRELPGTHGIDRVFPYYLTKASVSVNGASRTTTVLLSDQMQNVDMTMYSQARLIEKANTSYDSQILVDWQFCQDTSAKIGDVVSFSIGGDKKEFRIAAVYETNSIYDNGAVLAIIDAEEMEAIKERSNNNGYSGMYVSASNYPECRSYLTTDYRPLGRLKDRDQFDSDEQYQVHYDAIMATGYANEITDFRILETSLGKNVSTLMIWIGAVLSCIILVASNIIMTNRGCEKTYFTKHCLLKGQDVKPYYLYTFLCNVICAIAFYALFVLLIIITSKVYIPKEVFSVELVLIPIAIIVGECINMAYNRYMVGRFDIKAKELIKQEKEKNLQDEQAEGNEDSNSERSAD